MTLSNTQQELLANVVRHARSLGDTGGGRLVQGELNWESGRPELFVASLRGGGGEHGRLGRFEREDYTALADAGLLTATLWRGRPSDHLYFELQDAAFAAVPE
jgi:hypothetical protein